MAQIAYNYYVMFFCLHRCSMYFYDNPQPSRDIHVRGHPLVLLYNTVILLSEDTLALLYGWHALCVLTEHTHIPGLGTAMLLLL